jgi:hypothetical protein
MNSRLANGITFERDDKVHPVGSGSEKCQKCAPGYPHVHDALHSSTKGGCMSLVHGEVRHDLEAGFKQSYVIERCTGCGYEGSAGSTGTHSKYFVRFRKECAWIEVTEAGFAQAERNAGFFPKYGCGLVATAGFFSGNGIEGKVEYNP